MDHKIELQYKNVLIRPLCENDIEYLRGWRNNPSNSKYLRKIDYITAEMQKKWFENYLNNQDEIAFAIEETEDICEIVGSVSLYDFRTSQAEFGKILIGNKEAHGRKIGRNATIAVLKIAFGILNLSNVVLECNDSNIAAIRVYEEVGFVFKEKTDNIRYYNITREQFVSLYGNN